jgi:lysophospholipase L1-like esterase
MKVKHLLFAAFALFLILVTVGVVLEGALRIVFRRSMDFDIEMWKYAVELKRPAANPLIGHEHKPGGRAFLMGADVSINSLKLRDTERSFEKPAGVRRIVMLGDSLTFGWGVEQKDTPSKLLEALFAQKRPDMKVDVVNTGVGNYNTEMEVAYFLTEGTNYQPDLVILNYFINDAELTPRQQTGFLRQHSYAFAFFAARWGIFMRQFGYSPDWKGYYRSLYADEAPGWLRTKAAIERLAVYCRERNIPLVLAHYPELHEIEAYPFRDVAEKVRQAAVSNGVDFLDLLPFLQGKKSEALWVSPMDAHPNSVANGAFAEALYGMSAPRIAP